MNLLRTPLTTRLAVTIAGAALLLAGAPATALPPGGASSDTEGTSASVSPSSLGPGGTITFSIAGFPAGETVSVKIDDGEFCSEKGVHGACVVHQQKVDGQGRARGSFVLPSDLKPGKHWLRFLASAEITDDQGRYLGVKPYSLRGNSDFTLSDGSVRTPATRTPGSADETPGKKSGNTTPGAPSTGPAAGAPTAAPTAGTPQGGAAEAEEGAAPVDEDALRVPALPGAVAPEGDAADAGDDVRAASVAVQGKDEAASVPWFGAGALVLVALLAGLVVFRRRAGA